MYRFQRTNECVYDPQEFPEVIKHLFPEAVINSQDEGSKIRIFCRIPAHPVTYVADRRWHPHGTLAEISIDADEKEGKRIEALLDAERARVERHYYVNM